MKTTTLQLLPTTTYGTPSGNYDGSSQDFAGVQQKAANYYGGFGSLQTIAFFLENFSGIIDIEASLESLPATDEDWFRVDRLNSRDDSSLTTINVSRNITGNFTWIRARVTDFDDGTIFKVMMSY
jgi:hypothetical protein